jgi:hypothetical protein
MESNTLYLSLLFIALTLFLLIMSFGALNYAVKNHPGLKHYAHTLKLVLCGWLAITAVVAGLGFYRNFSALPPRLLSLLIPAIVGIVYLYRSKKFGSLLSQIPHHWIVYLQSFRILMEAILFMMYMEHLMPVEMTFEGQNFDIVTGTTALLVAYFGIVKHKLSKAALIGWNFLCMGILTVTIVTGILCAPTPLQVFMTDPANSIIAEFPFVWLPGFVVPFAFCLHILSIRKVLQD